MLNVTRALSIFSIWLSFILCIYKKIMKFYYKRGRICYHMLYFFMFNAFKILSERQDFKNAKLFLWSLSSTRVWFEICTFHKQKEFFTWQHEKLCDNKWVHWRKFAGRADTKTAHLDGIFRETRYCRGSYERVCMVVENMKESNTS